MLHKGWLSYFSVVVRIINKVRRLLAMITAHKFSTQRKLPTIIQGGMGAAVSNWRLARAVSCSGEMGVVSGTALDTVMIRRLQDGDPDGDIRRGLAAFPYPEFVQPILDKWYLPEGRAPGQPYKLKRLPVVDMNRSDSILLMVASFVEIYLAKEGHSGWVGINLLEKIQIPTLATLFGAILADVDAVLMGGGIPLGIPVVLDALAGLEEAELKINVIGAERDESIVMHFDPKDFVPHDAVPLTRPLFFPVISSETLAKTFLKKARGRVDGFVVEHHSAGGHNAPPRRGDAYGARDECNILKVAELGVPFWLAGNRATAAGLTEARQLGAQGVQIGTAFACCDESGITREIKKEVIERYKDGSLEVTTDFQASPTGYPFKRVDLWANAAPESCHQCDLGYLRHIYKHEDGSIGYRCPASIPETYAKMGGNPLDCEGKRCLCNGLLATIGHAQVKAGEFVQPLLTWGEQMNFLDDLLSAGRSSYSAVDLINYVRAGLVSTK